MNKLLDKYNRLSTLICINEIKFLSLGLFNQFAVDKYSDFCGMLNEVKFSFETTPIIDFLEARPLVSKRSASAQ